VPLFYECFTEQPALLQNFTGEEAAVLFAGIAHPAPMLTYLHKFTDEVRLMEFDDHHNFTRSDYEALQRQFEKLSREKKYIFTTEKDASRILTDGNFPEMLKPFLYVLPIKVKLVKNNSKFINKIRVFVEKKLQGEQYNLAPKRRLKKKELQQLEAERRLARQAEEKARADAEKAASRRKRIPFLKKDE